MAALAAALALAMLAPARAAPVEAPAVLEPAADAPASPTPAVAPQPAAPRPSAPVAAIAAGVPLAPAAPAPLSVSSRAAGPAPASGALPAARPQALPRAQPGATPAPAAPGARGHPAQTARAALPATQARSAPPPVAPPGAHADPATPDAEPAPPAGPSLRADAARPRPAAATAAPTRADAPARPARATPAALPPPAPGAIRIATFNAALNRPHPGALVQQLRLGGSRQIAAVVAILRRVRPDVLLLQEVDHDPRGVALALLADALAAPGPDALRLAHRFTAEVNAGQPSGHDLDGDGRRDGPGDAHGYGAFPGQYGMAVLSRFPLGPVRSFARLAWTDMPGAQPPPDHFPPGHRPRLSSKSHWDVTVQTPAGPLRLLASHPTPPVFDGPEDLNGRRNADEIRFWSDYLSGADWMTDDAGLRGGAGPEPVVVLGDLNADPADGDGRREAIRALLAHPRLQDPAPTSAGGRAAADPGHAGDPALDTAAFRGPGGLRADYVLPDRRLAVLGAGVFWPAPGQPGRGLVGAGARLVSSDHRLVWVDVRLP